MAPPSKILWWYERLADTLIARPEATLTEIAAEFNTTLSWLSTVRNSDVFREFFARRSAEASKELIGHIRAKGFAAAEMALDAINEKVATEGTTIPLPQLLEIVDVNMKRFGYDTGRKAPPGPQTNVNFNLGVVSASELSEARERMRKLRFDSVDAEIMAIEEEKAEPLT
jgi:hypothetical protein